MKGGLVESLPERARADLGIAAENPDVVGQPVQVLAGHRDADRDREALPKRTGGDVNPGEDRSWMTLQAGARLTVGQKLLVRDYARRLEHRVAERRRMALGVNEVIVCGILRVEPVVVQMTGQKDRDQVGRRHR